MRYDVSLTNFEDGTSRAHLIRYFFARGFVVPGDRVIDAACGTGYGSKMLSEVASQVYSYDQIEKINHESEKIDYYEVNLGKCIEYPDAEVGISLETIEHLKPESAKVFLDCVMKSLTKFLIFSVPLGEELGANPFHLQTFTRESAWALVERPGWKQFHSIMQGNHLLGVLYRL